jgi:hypothetical protein
MRPRGWSREGKACGQDGRRFAGGIELSGDGGEGERKKLSVTLVLLQVGVHGSRVSRLLARVGLGWGVEGIFVEDKTEQDRTGQDRIGQGEMGPGKRKCY